jgi:glycosyltransferase involved in cell wall biosynthesis
LLAVPTTPRKGFATVIRAWQRLCERPAWDGDLVVMGAEPRSQVWREELERRNLTDRVKFLGLRRDLPQILQACDALVAPTLYEPYGLAVHEALCCALPAFVSQQAGVAEQYPPELQTLLLADSDDAEDLAEKLAHWRDSAGSYRAAMEQLASRLRRYSWDDTAENMVRLVETEMAAGV